MTSWQITPLVNDIEKENDEFCRKLLSQYNFCCTKQQYSDKTIRDVHRLYRQRDPNHILEFIEVASPLEDPNVLWADIIETLENYYSYDATFQDMVAREKYYLPLDEFLKLKEEVNKYFERWLDAFSKE